MKIVFFGSSHFAIHSLKAIISAGFDISCVVTQPDKKKGRHLNLAHTVVKDAAIESGLKVFQPQDVNCPESVKLLKSLGADLFAVVSYGQILSQEVLDIPKVIPINLHASILPRYRGASPINYALLNGDKVTGVTVIKMEKSMDAGAVILQKSIEITDDDDMVTLENRLSVLGAAALIETLRLIENNDYKLLPQNEKKVILSPKLKKKDGLIEWSKPAKEIRNLVRAYSVWPGAFTYYKSKLLKIHKAEVMPQSLAGRKFSPGEVLNVTKDCIFVATGSGELLVWELQPEGKRAMSAEEFIAGHKIAAKDVFGKK